jgi:hypothetical protein
MNSRSSLLVRFLSAAPLGALYGLNVWHFVDWHLTSPVTGVVGILGGIALFSALAIISDEFWQALVTGVARLFKWLPWFD